MTGRRLPGLVLAVALPALAGLSGCSAFGVGGGGSGLLHVSAVFTDVGDLISGAPVEVADIPVGQVTGISLEGGEALVEMTVRSSVGLPADTIAKLERTTVLGEQFVALVPATTSPHAGPLRDGARLRDAVVVPGLEQVVSAGAQVFGAVDAAQLAELVDTGGQAFGGQAANLRTLIDAFTTVAEGYASRDGEIRVLVADIDRLSGTLAPNAQGNAEALHELARTTSILASESGRFESLLQALNGLSVQGRSFLEVYLAEIDDQLEALSVSAHALAARQQDLGALIRWLPAHNYATNAAAVNRFVQVLDDLIVCGLPNGGSNPSVAVDTCGPVGGGR